MYKDFLNFYFPLSTFFIVPFMKIFNWNLRVEPFISLLIALSTLVILFRIAQKHLKCWGALVSLSYFSLLFYFFTTAVQYTVEAMIGLIIALLLYRMLPYFKSQVGLNRLNLFFDGFLLALAALFDQVTGLLLGAIYFCLVYLIWKKGQKKGKISKAFILTSGLIFPFIIFSIYFWQLNALPDFLDNNILYYLNYVSLANSNTHSSLLPWNEIFIFYTPLLSSIPLIFNIKKEKPIFYFLIIAAIATIPTIVFSVFHPHHFLYALPLLALLGGLATDSAISSKIRPVKIIFIAILIIFAQQISLRTLPWYYQKAQNSKGLVLANDLTPEDSMYQPVSWVKENTLENTTLLVAGDTLFYLKSERLPSNKYFTLLPWHYKPLEKTSPVIKSKRPDFWVIAPSYLKRLKSPEGWNSPDIAEFIEEELKQCYVKIKTFPDWEIWQKTCPTLI